MSYEGFGNWLITIAPYFVPLPLLLLSGLMLVVKDQWYALLLPVLGFVTVSHLHYLKAQLHTGQTDLKQVGWLFTWLFLPGANVLMLTLVTLLTLGGQPLGAYVGELERELLTMLSEAQRFIKHYS